ncbi:histone-lysine N-methyltransferase 2D-like [Haemorhous mexicanus]|uniref:histone-lysine N-methyltransferase 2D-like n=1 Tax=Haemorhous mexicanus TaxID=30427 RepID=UPI0028BF073E|nr:histone-lysine N-methyltransferase 2D-like [Haemorhous mexicanus]
MLHRRSSTQPVPSRGTRRGGGGPGGGPQPSLRVADSPGGGPRRRRRAAPSSRLPALSPGLPGWREAARGCSRRAPQLPEEQAQQEQQQQQQQQEQRQVEEQVELPLHAARGAARLPADRSVPVPVPAAAEPPPLRQERGTGRRGRGARPAFTTRLCGTSRRGSPGGRRGAPEQGRWVQRAPGLHRAGAPGWLVLSLLLGHRCPVSETMLRDHLTPAGETPAVAHFESEPPVQTEMPTCAPILPASPARVTLHRHRPNSSELQRHQEMSLPLKTFGSPALGPKQNHSSGNEELGSLENMERLTHVARTSCETVCSCA